MDQIPDRLIGMVEDGAKGAKKAAKRLRRERHPWRNRAKTAVKIVLAATAVVIPMRRAMRSH